MMFSWATPILSLSLLYSMILYDTKRSEIHIKTAKLYKKGAAFKKKSCEIKGGSHEKAAMILMIISLFMHKGHY